MRARFSRFHGPAVLTAVVLSVAGTFSAAPQAQIAPGIAAPLGVARQGQTATTLADGRIVVGGGDNGSAVTSSIEIYLPSTDSWSIGTPMPAARTRHAATRLLDGRVLVTGGTSADGLTLRSAEIYDPAGDTWTEVSPMITPRFGHTAVALASGTVLACGGFIPGAADPAEPAADCESLDPSLATNTWSAVAPMLSPHGEHTATRLADGRMLVVGGYGPSGSVGVAEIFDPVAGTWVNAAPAMARAEHAAALLADGRVLVAGGVVGVGNPASSAELYDSTTNTWTPTASLSHVRAGHAAALLPSGDVLVAGGYDGTATTNTTEIWRLPATVTVTKSPATATLMLSKSPQQYSDLETFEATMSPAVPGVVIAGSVTFKVGTQQMGAAPLLLEGAVYKARLTAALVETVPGQMMPTTPFGRTVTAVINAPNFQVANPTRALVITKEDARATYDGTLSALTSGTSTTNPATVTLRATVRDITAAEPGQDGNAGDIRGAYVQFYNRETGLAISPALPVALANPANTSTGLVSYNWMPTIGTANSQTFRVGTMLGTYYIRNSHADDALVTVSKPLSSRFISGGGSLNLLMSTGSQAGDAGSVNGFGVAVKYSGNGSTPTGQFQTMVRSAGKIFHVKSATLSSLVVSGNTATLKGTASIYDITTGSLLVDSGATFDVKLVDSGAGPIDAIAITVRRGTAVWFTSAPGGALQMLSGGDITVR